MIQDQLSHEASFPENEFTRQGLEKVHAQILSDHWSQKHDRLAREFIKPTIEPLYGSEIASGVTETYNMACGLRENCLTDSI